MTTTKAKEKSTKFVQKVIKLRAPTLHSCAFLLPPAFMYQQLNVTAPFMMILLNYRAFNFCLKRLSEEEIFSFSRVEGVNTKRKTRNNNSKAFTVLIIKCDQHQREKSSTAIVCSFHRGCGVKVNNNLKEFARLEAIRVSVEKPQKTKILQFTKKSFTNVALTRDSLACDCV